MHWLSVALALSLAVPIVMPLLRGRHAAFWTVAWNFAVFLVMVVAGYASNGALYARAVWDLGFDTSLLGDPGQWYRAFSAMYVHSGALHVLMNMLILMLVGVPFEDRVGTRRWLFLYLASGIIGALVDAGFASASGSSHLGIGASGAIFGVMGAFAVLYPRDEIPMVLGFVFLNRVPVFAAVLVSALMETLYLIAATQDNVGHIVHAASLVAGVALALPLSRLKGPSEKEAGRALDLEALRALAIDEKLSSTYEKIRKEDVPVVRDAWMEELVRKARCPKCGKPLAHVKGRFFCACGYRLQYRR